MGSGLEYNYDDLRAGDYWYYYVPSGNHAAKFSWLCLNSLFWSQDSGGSYSVRGHSFDRFGESVPVSVRSQSFFRLWKPFSQYEGMEASFGTIERFVHENGDFRVRYITKNGSWSSLVIRSPLTLVKIFDDLAWQSTE